MTVIFSKPTAADIEPYEVGGYADYYTHHIKVTATDEDHHSAFVLIPPSMLNRLGKSYIESHARLHYEPFFEEWFLTISQNDFYNDPQRNPEKTIPVRFVELENGTGREVYQGTENGKYYLRENYAPREQCARWLVCGKQRRTDDGDEPRPNLIFQCNEQTEKVTYDDWNGTMAYSTTYNPNFRPQ